MELKEIFPRVTINPSVVLGVSNSKQQIQKATSAKFSKSCVFPVGYATYFQSLYKANHKENLHIKENK